MAADIDFETLYTRFSSPIASLDCGERCAPYNEWGAPFCCDTRHAVPTAYLAEWVYLQANTDLWRLWESNDPKETASLREQTPPGQALIACLGHEACQRDFRSLTCRAFPFFPYITKEGRFVGLSYYWEYENCCWVISNLQVVTPAYQVEFVLAYDFLFKHMPQELQAFRYQSMIMRRVFERRKRAIPLLHRNGNCYKITPRNERMRRVAVERLPKFGAYKIAAELPFPGE